MPYASNRNLPAPVRAHLPAGAQDIYREAFNHAFERYGRSDEARAHRIAWAAVKRKYEKDSDGMWVRTSSKSGSTNIAKPRSGTR